MANSRISHLTVSGTTYDVIGSTTFSITLNASSWSNSAQTVSNSNFINAGYVYTVSPSYDQIEEWSDAGIYAEDVTTNGSMIFNCSTTPTDNINVNILVTEVE